VEILNIPYFGLIISILAFEFGLFLNKKFKFSLLNPLLISIVTIISFLTKISPTFLIQNHS